MTEKNTVMTMTIKLMLFKSFHPVKLRVLGVILRTNSSLNHKNPIILIKKLQLSLRPLIYKSEVLGSNPATNNNFVLLFKVS